MFAIGIIGSLPQDAYKAVFKESAPDNVQVFTSTCTFGDDWITGSLHFKCDINR